MPPAPSRPRSRKRPIRSGSPACRGCTPPDTTDRDRLRPPRPAATPAVGRPGAGRAPRMPMRTFGTRCARPDMRITYPRCASRRAAAWEHRRVGVETLLAGVLIAVGIAGVLIPVLPGLLLVLA